ncbi:tyrosine phosphatase family-domain-containing protein [Xylariales sp. PMI_506]|nr:tyrosine phosphatase family-domain-containing protein [Xylariales sp. PMI_506]
MASLGSDFLGGATPLRLEEEQDKSSCTTGLICEVAYPDAMSLELSGSESTGASETSVESDWTSTAAASGDFPEAGLDTSLPPQNFAVVTPGIYRSSYPQPHNYNYLAGLKLKTVITLVQKEMPQGFQSFIEENGIRHWVFDMAGTKKAEIPSDMMQSIISLVTDETNYPLLIHCNQGRHRTGCVVGVLRKLHGWDTSEILVEYETYAWPKVRETDVQYLSTFRLVATPRDVAPRKSEPSALTVSHFLLLTLIAALSLCIWLLTLRSTVPHSPRPPTARKDES